MRGVPARVLVVGGVLVAALSTGAGVMALFSRDSGHTTAIASGPSAGTASLAAPCTRQTTPTSPPPTPTTITTLQQAYDCILAHHYGGPVLDHRTLLAAAFAGFTQELQRRGQDQPTATLPALTGNRGGAPVEVARLLGAFAHGRIFSYDCDVRGNCTPNRTDDTVPLLGLRLVVLIDRACASACDAFSAAVKDLGLGTLVGTRTAGGVAGPAASWLLDDNSLLRLPERHHLGANNELINTIGVAADHHAPLTANDLSTGRDPGVATALSLLP